MSNPQNVAAPDYERGNSVNFGVNVAGFINTESGLGEGARSTIRSLDVAGIPRVLNNANLNIGLRSEDLTYTEFSTENPHPINIVQINADVLGEYLDKFGDKYFQQKYNIGYWAWENLEFPAEWSFAFGYFDEIWTPSNFCVEAISAVSPVPVLRIPHAIQTAKTSFSRQDLGLPENKFVFLFIFDFSSSYERKNPAAVIEAFKKAFSDNDDVLLVVKSSNSKQFPDQYSELKKSAAHSANIHFIDKYLLRDEINSLIANCDSYVSLHRSEGFGLTLAEAMAYGKPVIATNYSANIDFMNVGNSFPVRYELVTLDRDIGYFKKGTQWAEPSVEHAADIMKSIFADKGQAARIGQRAAADLKENLSPEAVGIKIKSRLERIYYLRNGFADLGNTESSESGAINPMIQEQMNAEISRLRKRLDIVESSSFWKARNQWWKLKKRLGLTHYE